MVSREIMQAHAERVTALLVFHEMLAAAGNRQTIYDFTPEERAGRIHPAYAHSGYFTHDTNKLAGAGLLPKKGTRHQRAVGHLVRGIEELIDQGVDAFQLTRRQLARQLRKDHSGIAHVVEDAAKEIERQYHRRPTFADSIRSTYAKNRRAVSDAYTRLTKMCPQLKPSIIELALEAVLPRTTVAGWCYKLELDVDTSRTRMSPITHLLRGLASVDPTDFVSDRRLSKRFPDADIRRIRKYITVAYDSGYLAKPARLYVLYNNIIYKLMYGSQPDNAVRYSGALQKDLPALLLTAKKRLQAERYDGRPGSFRTKTIVDALQRRVDSA